MRLLDKMIQTEIFGDKEFEVFNDEDYVLKDGILLPLPEYSSDSADSMLILDKLKDSTMTMYTYSHFGGVHKFEMDHLSKHGKHEVYAAAVCLAALNSINHDGKLTEQIRDAVFTYNYNRGIL